MKYGPKESPVRNRYFVIYPFRAETINHEKSEIPPKEPTTTNRLSPPGHKSTIASVITYLQAAKGIAQVLYSKNEKKERKNHNPTHVQGLE